MKNKSLLLLFTLLALLFEGQLKAQTQTVNHSVPFSSGMQNMWGPSWNAFSINMDINLFEQSWNETFNTGNSAIVSILGQQFGAAVQGGISGTIGSNFSLSGFTTGEVQVDYPIDVELTMSDDLSYDQGDEVTIETEYTVENGWALESFYPTVGEAKLDFYIEIGASLSATICAFGCTTFPIIPNFNTGQININLLTINSSGVEVLTAEAGGFGIGPVFSYPLFPVTLSDVDNGALSDYGLDATLSLPYVETTDYLNGQNMTACGNSTYLELELEIFQLLSKFLTESGVPPLVAIGNFFENLSGSQGFGPASVNWNFLSASFNVDLVNNQCFYFTPTVYGKFAFPVAVDYTIVNPLGNTVSSGTSAIINMEIGNDLKYKFPCYYEHLDITPTYSINGRFRNNTYDSISFSFQMSALEFSLQLPSIIVTPAIPVPEICIPYAYPCPSWSKPWRWCTGSACTPPFTIPAVSYNGWSYSIGPLWELIQPIASIEYDWYDNTWDLEGFSEYIRPSFAMKANILAVSNTHTDVSCYGGSNGSIDVTVGAVSPATPYTYVWTNGVTTQDLTGLAAGPYEVEVYDMHDCQLFTGATILEPEHPLDVSYVKTDKSCNAVLNDGSIDLLIQGGTGPYTQLWGDGAITEDRTGLAQGNYTVTVTDTRGCTFPLSIAIDQPGVLGQNGIVKNVDCRGNADGTIEVETFGGNLPYAFSWLSGQTQEDVTGLTAGSYTLTVTDAKGCTSQVVYDVTEPAQHLGLAATKVDVLCKNNSTGSIDVTTTGGTPGYEFTWVNSQGVVLPFQSEDVSGFAADTYTVSVVDSKDCPASLSIMITEPALVLASTPMSQNVNCFGDATGQIDPLITGGTSPYSYAWSDGSTNALLDNVTSGNYTLTVTDNNGCVEVFSYVLTEPSEPLSLTLIGTDILCFGESTGAISSIVTGGTQGYDYSWNIMPTSPNVTGLVAGNYNLTVTDDKGCSVNDNITLVEPLAPLALTSTVINVDCFGNNTGSIDVSTSGGTTPYGYYWSNGSSIVMTQVVEDVSNQFADSYDVLVTDAHGCQANLNSTITQPSAPIVITSLTDDVNCYGMNDGAIDITVTGGTITSDYTYAWSNGTNTQDVSGAVAGNYSVTITDDNLCSLSKDFIIKQPILPLTAVLNATAVKCNSDSDGQINSEVTGGTMPYQYLWSNGETSDEIYNLVAGNYTLTVTDVQGCISFTGSVVNEPAQALVVNTTVGDVQCFGDNDGSIVIDISGGVEPYYFNWGDQNEILVNNFSETITGLNIGEYFIRVTDRNGCINEQFVVVNQPQPLELTYILTDALCFGGTSGAADVTVTGGTPAYTMSWSSGQSTEDISGVASGSYVVTAVDNQGCETSKTLFIEQPPLIEIAYEIIELSCIDQGDAAILVNPYGGINPLVYNWSNGVTTQNNENLSPGNYVLTITDANSCQFNQIFEITDNNVECVFIPNTFTPNDDLYNDTWVIRNIDLYPYATVKVFNKWGNNIFDSNGVYDPWDGTHNGNPLPAEVYYYIITLGNSEENEYTGTITIIR